MTISFRRKSQFPIHPAAAAMMTAILALFSLPVSRSCVISLDLLRRVSSRIKQHAASDLFIIENRGGIERVGK